MGHRNRYLLPKTCMTYLKSARQSSGDRTVAVSTSFQPVKGSLSPTRFVLVTTACFLVFIAVLLISPWIGASGISMKNVVTGVYPDREIFLIARLPRVLFGALAGGALAIAGV